MNKITASLLVGVVVACITGLWILGPEPVTLVTTQNDGLIIAAFETGGGYLSPAEFEERSKELRFSTLVMKVSSLDAAEIIDQTRRAGKSWEAYNYGKAFRDNPPKAEPIRL